MNGKEKSVVLPQEQQRMTNEKKLKARMEELRKIYAPFIRNRISPLGLRKCSEPLNPWKFRYTGEKSWKDIRLPEYKGKTSWEGEYRTKFHLPTELKNFPRLLLHFGGVETTVTAVLNGKHVGEHSGGSDPFDLDITDAIDRSSENDLRLHVTNGLAVNGIEYPRAFSREPFRKEGVPYKLVGEWGNMNGREGRAGGIWRDVALMGTAETWIQDALIEPDPENSRVRLRVTVGSKRDFAGTLAIEILPRNFEGKTAGAKQDLAISPGISDELVLETDIPEQRWWSPDEPYLYTARITIQQGDALQDGKDFTFGQRSFRYDDCIQRYRLNGIPMRFRGTSTINSLNMAYLRGDEKNLVDQILLAKAANFTIFRHHIMSPVEEVDEYLDMYGMLSQPEMPIWGRFHPELIEPGICQLPRILRQHYNHPSTVLFAISSESGFYREAYAAYQKEAIEIIERDFPLMEWKIEGVRGNLSGTTRPRSLAGDLYEYKPDLYDVHEYAGWYVNFGSLEPVRGGETLMTVGEFGPESLSNHSTMESCWPQGTYPGNADEIVMREDLPFGPQYSWAESRWFLPTPRTLHGWIEATQNHSAFVHRYQAGIFRRSPSVLGYHQYFLNEPVWNTWRKTLCGADLSPKAAYFAMAEMNEPVLLDLFCEKEHYLPGNPITAGVYLANDSGEDIQNAEVRLFVVSPDGEVNLVGKVEASAKTGMPAGLEPVEFTAPGGTSSRAGTPPGIHTLKAFLLSNGKTISSTAWNFRLLDPSEWPWEKPDTSLSVLHFAGSRESLAIGRHLQDELGDNYRCYSLSEIRYLKGEFSEKLLILDGVEQWQSLPTDLLREFLEAGGRLLMAELKPSALGWLIPGLEVVSSPARALFRPDENHPIFASRDHANLAAQDYTQVVSENHAKSKSQDPPKLTAEDFRLWDYVPVREPILRGPMQPYAGKRTRDLVECPIRFGGKEFDRIAHIRGDDRIRMYSIADADRNASSLLEIIWGEGRLLISQARLFERYFSHPLAKILFHKEIEYLGNAAWRQDSAGGAGDFAGNTAVLRETVSREKFDVIQRF